MSSDNTVDGFAAKLAAKASQRRRKTEETSARLREAAGFNLQQPDNRILRAQELRQLTGNIKERQEALYNELRVEPDNPGRREWEELPNHIRGWEYGVRYKDILNSPKWKETARKAKECCPRCWVCADSQALEVHHLTYERLEEENANDLVVLCRRHHRQVHERAEEDKDAARSFAWILADMKARRELGG